MAAVLTVTLIAAAIATSPSRAQSTGLVGNDDLLEVGLSDILAGKLERGQVSLGIAAGEGSGAAAATLAAISHTGLGRPADFSKAAKWAATAAESGSPLGARIYGWMQLTGYGGRADPVNGRRYLEAAAEADDAQAMYLLARLLEGGTAGVERDIPAAIGWYEKAVSQGYPFAKWRLGELLISEAKTTREKNRGVSLLREATTEGVISAHAAYARQLYLGEGVVQNYEQAFHHFAYAAKLGHTGAQNMVGYLLLKGLGTRRHLKAQDMDGKEALAMAIDMLQRASVQGHSGALYNLAELHRISKNYVEAHAFYNLASSRGTPGALQKRKEMQARLSPGQLQAAQEYASKWPSQFELQLQSTGSGFFISLGGAAVTNHHVVDDCDDVRLRIDDTIRPARVMLAVEKTDLAVVQIGHKEGVQNTYRVARLAPEEERSIGEPVAVFGWPYAQILSAAGTFTTGILSSPQGPGGNDSFIQISAPVSPGNSGGPVFDELGRVIGVVNAQLAKERQQNINFAVKVGVLMKLLEKYKQPYYPAQGHNQEPLDGRDLYKLAKASSAHFLCYRYGSRSGND